MYKIEKHDRITGEVNIFNNLTKGEAICLFKSYFIEDGCDYYNYSIDSCIKLGHASFKDFYILLSRAEI